jgi:ATP-dependent helicase HrpA
VVGYPALVDEGGSVALRVLASEAEAEEALWAGTRRLLRLTLPSPARAVEDVLTRRARFALARRPNDSVAGLVDDCIDAAVDDLLASAGGPARDAAGFASRQQLVRAQLSGAAAEIAGVVATILTTVAAVEVRLAALTLPTLQPAVADMRAQLARLVYPGFVSGAGRQRLADVARYLQGIEKRLDRLPADAARDRDRMQRLARLEHDYERLLDRAPTVGAPHEELEQLGWQLEELRVSTFAQMLGTPRPVSEERIRRALRQLAAG